MGYTGGEKANPTYHEVGAGGTGHLESIEIVFDPKKVSYEKLLDVFWHNVDPTNPYGQFCDNGSSVPDRDLLRERRAAGRGRGLEEGDRRRPAS